MNNKFENYLIVAGIICLIILIVFYFKFLHKSIIPLSTSNIVSTPLTTSIPEVTLLTTQQPVISESNSVSTISFNSLGMQNSTDSKSLSAVML